MPLQRYRKNVVYNRDFFNAIGLEQRRDVNILDHRLIISHHSCVDSLCKMNQQNNTQSDALNDAAKMISLNSVCVSSMDDIQKIGENIDYTANIDEGCTNNSAYSSAGEDDELKKHEHVERSSSSDSALGLEDDIISGIGEWATKNQKRRNTLTVTDYIPLRPALLPVAEPTTLPDTTTIQLSQADNALGGGSQVPIVVPSKMLLEARIVEIPAVQPIIVSDTMHVQYSRRESNASEAGNIEEHRMRIVRTPSVVVSDYSDDTLCGITLEELEFFRQQRKLSLGAALDHCSSQNTSTNETTIDTDYISDLSAASSYSNLDCCGSTNRGVDDNFASGLETPERKLSNCSTCSSLDGCSEENLISSMLFEALSQQQRKKKVCKCSITQIKAVAPSNDASESL